MCTTTDAPTTTFSRDDLKPLIKTADAAEILDISPRKVRDMCSKGEIKAVKIGSDWRVNSAALLEQFGI